MASKTQQEQAAGGGGREQQLRVQRVMFLRHGVAKHNLRDPTTGQPPDIYSPEMLDPPLVDQGRDQARRVGKRLRRDYSNGLFDRVELVIASPLTRCLETAQLVFEISDDEGKDSSNTEAARPPLICLEQVREAFGMHFPDKRRNKSKLQNKFPVVNFDPSMTEVDSKWSPTSRETLDMVLSRIQEFFHWVVQRPEQTIFVVSHGVWIECCLNEYFPMMLQNGKQRVYNCDCFVTNLVSRNNNSSSGGASFVRMENVRKI